MECISSIQVKVQYGLIKCLITSILREHQNNFNKILKFLLLLINYQYTEWIFFNPKSLLYWWAGQRLANFFKHRGCPKSVYKGVSSEKGGVKFKRGREKIIQFLLPKATSTKLFSIVSLDFFYQNNKFFCQNIGGLVGNIQQKGSLTRRGWEKNRGGSRPSNKLLKNSASFTRFTCSFSNIVTS